MCCVYILYKLDIQKSVDPGPLGEVSGTVESSCKSGSKDEEIHDDNPTPNQGGSGSIFGSGNG